MSTLHISVNENQYKQIMSGKQTFCFLRAGVHRVVPGDHLYIHEHKEGSRTGRFTVRLVGVMLPATVLDARGREVAVNAASLRGA